MPLAPARRPARQVAEISALLNSLDEAAAESGQSLADETRQRTRKQAGAGPARNGQRPARRAAGQASADGVALACASRWAAARGPPSMQLDDETRDLLEVAALLHDVGKIGVPDKVLLKPGRLSPEEIALMSRHAALHDRDARQLRRAASR